MQNPKLNLIVVMGNNRAIGNNNRLLWHIPEDLKRFKELTERHVVIMGRKTYESIGKPLPNRTNIIVSSKADFKPEGCIVVSSINEALTVAKNQEKDEIFIIGGGQIYEQAINLADKLYLTVVEDSPEADTYFPDYSAFSKIVFEEKHQSGNLKFKYLELEK